MCRCFVFGVDVGLVLLCDCFGSLFCLVVDVAVLACVCCLVVVFKDVGLNCIDNHVVVVSYTCLMLLCCVVALLLCCCWLFDVCLLCFVCCSVLVCVWF